VGKKMANIIRPVETWKKNIVKPDQHLASYVTKKMMEPDTKIVVRSFRRADVEAVDRIVELAHGYRSTITSNEDWRIVEELIKFFIYKWPDQWTEFKSSLSDIKETRRDGGYSESKEIKYVGSLPPKLMGLIKAIFPDQQWDKKFLNKFVNRFKLFKVG
jgi:hypothetical protein